MSNAVFLFLFAIVALSMLCSTLVALILFRRKRRERRTPLTSSLLRSPGETLRKELENHDSKLGDYVLTTAWTSLLPVFFLSVLMTFGDKKLHLWQLLVNGVFYIAIIAWQIRRLYVFMVTRQNLALGLDAELAVGQELNHLMLLGCRVFHDFPAENFNIDHVVVGPGGIIAVETKGRAKPDKGRGSVDATVVYDGQILRFPDWHESEPLEQAKRQAEWLQKWLCSAVGEIVQVKPALALPGWFIERTKLGSVFIFNGKNPVALAKPLDSSPTMDPQLVQRIAHQLEQRCRDVEPVAYRKEKK
ncbi:MAG: hypothetical protein A2005_01255 [Desulfuromonadales bacterium GWC2_61_20]|nr:MAG: hypothetical protein A2005_01255 [Desulfuromonadales bacterium GWC2_61_20]HAD04814.1 hypothetical protein [Desulfuromonas sp.]